MHDRDVHDAIESELNERETQRQFQRNAGPLLIGVLVLVAIAILASFIEHFAKFLFVSAVYLAPIVGAVFGLFWGFRQLKRSNRSVGKWLIVSSGVLAIMWTPFVFPKVKRNADASYAEFRRDVIKVTGRTIMLPATSSIKAQETADRERKQEQEQANRERKQAEIDAADYRRAWAFARIATLTGFKAKPSTIELAKAVANTSDEMGQGTPSEIQDWMARELPLTFRADGTVTTKSDYAAFVSGRPQSNERDALLVAAVLTTKGGTLLSITGDSRDHQLRRRAISIEETYTRSQTLLRRQLTDDLQRERQRVSRVYPRLSRDELRTKLDQFVATKLRYTAYFAQLKELNISETINSVISE